MEVKTHRALLSWHKRSLNLDFSLSLSLPPTTWLVFISKNQDLPPTGTSRTPGDDTQTQRRRVNLHEGQSWLRIPLNGRPAVFSLLPPTRGVKRGLKTEHTVYKVLLVIEKAGEVACFRNSPDILTTPVT